jgi:hypothetical protein
MRAFPLFAVALLLSWLAPVSSWAQQLECKPCAHGFGEVQVGDTVSASIELLNTGTRTLKITSKAEQGGEFSLGSFPVPVRLKPGASIALPFTFTPTAKGYSHGIITLASNDPKSPLNISVRGTGFIPNSPELRVTPATLNFGNVTVASSASLQATLTASNAAVTISSDRSASSEFAIVGLNLPVTIQPGQSLGVTIQFTPSASGTASSKVGFISNAANSLTVEPVTGTGVAQTSYSVNLSWEAASGSPVGYNVYRGTAQAGPFSMINSTLDASTSYTDSTVVCGTTYYYVTTAVDAQGQQSAYSNEVEAVIPSS